MSDTPTIITPEVIKEIKEIVENCKAQRAIPFGIALLTISNNKIQRTIFNDNEEDKFYTIILTQDKLLHLNSDTIYICGNYYEVKEVVNFLLLNIDFFNDSSRTFEL